MTKYSLVKLPSFFNCIIILFVLLFVGCTYPAMYNLMWFGFDGILFSIAIFICWFIFIILYKKSFRFKVPNKYFTITLVICACYQCFRILVINDNFNELLRILLVFLLVIMCINSFKEEILFKYLFNWHYIMLLSLIIGLFFLVKGYLPLINSYTLSDESGITMYNYGFFFIKTTPDWAEMAGVYRPTGWYDEPGSLANVLLFLLIYNKLFFKSKKAEFIFLFGGIFTFSFAHIIISIIYLSLFYLKKNARSFAIIFSFCIFVVLGYFWQPTNKYGIAYKEATYGRIEKLFNDNYGTRNFSGTFDVFKKYFFTVGNTKENIRNEFPNSSVETIWFNLARNGLFGSIIYYAPVWIVFILLFKKKKLSSDQIKLLCLLMINFIQRPDYYYPLYFLFIYYIWYSKINTSNRNVLEEA